MQRGAMIILAASALVLAGCMRLKGVVVDEASGKPFTSAVFTIGRPGGIAVFARHPVDSRGNFDFRIGPGEETNLYIYDSVGDPTLSIRKLQQFELGQNMRIRMHTTAADPFPSLHDSK